MKFHQYLCGNPAEIWDARRKVKDYDPTTDNHDWTNGTPPVPEPSAAPKPLTAWREIEVTITELP